MRQATACNMLSMVDLQVLSLEGYLSVRQLYYLALGQDAMWGNYEINVNSDFTVYDAVDDQGIICFLEPE